MSQSAIRKLTDTEKLPAKSGTCRCGAALFENMACIAETEKLPAKTDATIVLRSCGGADLEMTVYMDHDGRIRHTLSDNVKSTQLKFIERHQHFKCQKHYKCQLRTKLIVVFIN